MATIGTCSDLRIGVWGVKLDTEEARGRAKLVIISAVLTAHDHDISRSLGSRYDIDINCPARKS